MNSIFTTALSAAGLLLLLGACKKDSTTPPAEDGTKPLTPFTCASPAESTDYKLYPLGAGGSGVGDVMPYYDTSTGITTIYYLRDVYTGPTQRHPVYAYTTSDFVSYAETGAGEVLSSGAGTCDQDFSIGTGSVVQKDGQYYFFYTGNNPNAAGCTNQKEGVLLATSPSLDQKFTKQPSFSTIYAPSNLGYDFNDNFRDPFVTFDQASGSYLMLVAARKNVGGGNFKGVLARYSSVDLLNWSYQGVFYSGGLENFFNMEAPSVFQLGSTYYLMFSDQGSQTVRYRKSSSPYGPWSAPSNAYRFDGNGFYAAKVVVDKSGSAYVLGWLNRQTGNSDTGGRVFGGNLVVHQLHQTANGDLTVSLPQGTKAYLEGNSAAPHVNAQVGDVSTSGGNTFTINSAEGSFQHNVVFDPVAAPRFKVSTTVNYSSATKDFGFMLGACDNYNGFYSLRFVPSQNRFSLDKIDRRNVTFTSTTVDVPFALSPNTDYTVDIVEENSVVVVYLNNTVALTCRVYRAPQSSWGLFADNAAVTFKNVTISTPK